MLNILNHFGAILLVQWSLKVDTVKRAAGISDEKNGNVRFQNESDSRFKSGSVRFDEFDKDCCIKLYFIFSLMQVFHYCGQMTGFIDFLNGFSKNAN